MENEKRRLIELKKEAESLWHNAKQQDSSESGSSGDEITKDQTRSLELEKEKRVELERQLAELKQQKNNTNVTDNGDKIKELEQALGLERLKRQEMERILSEKQKQEELEKLAAAERARKDMMTERAIQERLPSKVTKKVSMKTVHCPSPHWEMGIRSKYPKEQNTVPN